MATVITNLLSAIPFFGQDLVESTYATELCSCLVYKGNNLPVLATIGTVSTQALKKGNRENSAARRWLPQNAVVR